MKEAGVGVGTGSRSRQVVTSCPMSSLMTMFPILSSSSARECREALAVARFSTHRHRNQPATSCTQHSLWCAKKPVPCWTSSCVQHNYTFLCTTRLHIPVYSIIKHSCVQHNYTSLCTAHRHISVYSTIIHFCVQHNYTFLCTAQLHISVYNTMTHSCVQHNNTPLCTAQLPISVYNTNNYKFLCTEQLPFLCVQHSYQFLRTTQSPISMYNAITNVCVHHS